MFKNNWKGQLGVGGAMQKGGEDKHLIEEV